MYDTGYYATGYHATDYYMRSTISTEDDFQGTWDRFREQQQQRVMQEDEELIIIARAFIEIISCRH